MRSPRLLPAALLLALVALPARAQTDPRLAEIDRIFARFDSPSSPGCALGVVDDGRLVVRKGYGSANLDFQVPITTRTVFYLASVSKQFTTASVILLAKDGRLSLDDDVRKHFPELPDYGQRISVRQLINHTSGLRDYLTLMPLAGMRGEDVHSDDEILQLIFRQRALNFPAGSEYLYSNSGYYLLAELVRRVSGKSLRELAEERIFRPLGMTQTHFHDDRLMVVPQRASAYSPSEGGFVLNVWANFDKVGSGGLMSSVEDLAKWDRNFYTWEVGGDFLRDELHRRGVLTNGDTIVYAGGLNVSEMRGLRTVRHGGSTAGYRTEILRFPDQRFSVIVLCNVSVAAPGRYADAVAELWLGERMSPRVARGGEAGDASPDRPASRSTAPRASAAAMAAYVGDYESDELQTTWSVAMRGDTLVLRHRVLGDRVMRPVEADRFAAGGWSIEFVREQGRVSGMKIGQGRVRAIRFERR